MAKSDESAETKDIFKFFLEQRCIVRFIKTDKIYIIFVRSLMFLKKINMIY